MLLWKWESRYLLKLVFSFYFDLFPELELLDHMVVLFLIFWVSSILFSTGIVPIYNLTNTVQGSALLHMQASICYHLSFGDSHSNMEYLTVVFNLNFPSGSILSLFFMYLLGFCLSSLVKCLLEILLTVGKSIQCWRVVKAVFIFNLSVQIFNIS